MLIKVELHTSVELEIGKVLTGEIKVLETLNGEKNGKSVVVTTLVGRRIRPIGYINSMPQYVNVVADQLISAMEKNSLEKIELEVFQKMDQKVDERNVYILKILDTDVTTLMLTDSVGSNMGGNVLNVINYIEEDDSVIVKDEENKSLNTKELVQKAINELSSNEDKDGEDDNNTNTNTVTRIVKRIGVGGASRVNPKKMKVIQLIKDGNLPTVTLRSGKNDVINVIFEEEAAGELEFLNVEDMIDVSDVESVSIDGVKPFGYYVNITIKSNEKNILDDNSVDLNEESLFVELMKPILSELSSNNVDLDADKIAKNDAIVNQVWSLVGKVKGKEIVQENDIATGEESFTNTNNVKVDINKQQVKKGKKITKEGAKKIFSYLVANDVPMKYVNKIISSYKEYPEQYLERIPSFEDKGFTPWKYTGRGPNLLKLAIISIEKGKNLRLVGGKGAGKNTLLSTLACVYQRPLFSQSANRDTDITHLFGDKTIDVIEMDGQIAQTVEFEKGLLVEAMEVGGFYEFGEGNACRPEVTMALHSVLDSRREADVNGYSLVKAHEDFAFVLTMNVDYEGCNSLNQAFRDRFTTISFPSPDSIASILKEACPTATTRDIKICDKLYSDILRRVDELQTDEIVTIRGYINALDLAEDLSLKEALQMCVAYNVSDDELIVQEILEIIDSIVA